MDSPVLPVRVRFAPSPTGPMTLGNARTALFNYLYARHLQGTFILRIEDTDTQRSKIEHEKDLIEALRWLGVLWDEGPDVGGAYGPYRQSERLPIYRKYLEMLLRQRRAYYCYCTAEELEKQRHNSNAFVYRGLCRKYMDNPPADRAPQIIRFLNDSDHHQVFHDLIRGAVSTDPATVGDFAIAKNLDSPLYNFAVVVDDEEMKITHVIRGEDHISNTPKQMLLRAALHFSGEIIYAHLPLILAADRSKLSKRTAEVSIISYRQTGYLPSAIVNFLALLGWHPTGDEEIFPTAQDIAAEFEIERVQKAGAIFDSQKLEWVNKQHIVRLSDAELLELLMPALRSAGVSDQTEKLKRIIAIERLRMSNLSDFVPNTSFFFSLGNYETELLIWKKDSRESTLKVLQAISENIQQCTAESFQSTQELTQVLAPLVLQYGKGSVYWPFRVALSGLSGSPDPLDIAGVLGKNETIARLGIAIKKLQSG